MEPATLLSLCALLIAFGGWLLNIWKAFRERRLEVRAEQDRAKRISVEEMKADVERDSIAVHSAEAALLLMEKMLNQCTASAEKTQQRLETAEWEAVKCQQELRARNRREES